MIKRVFKNTQFVVLTLFISLVMTSCFDSESQDEIDEKLIKNYISDNNIDATRHEATGIYYVINEPGEGEHPQLNATINVRYKGYYLNGNVFDETTNNEPREFILNELIPGWQVCLLMLKQGGKGKFIIPSYWGYQDGNVRVFDIELVSFTNPPSDESN